MTRTLVPTSLSPNHPGEEIPTVTAGAMCAARLPTARSSGIGSH